MAGSLLTASGPFLFFFPTRVGSGGSHFFLSVSFFSLSPLCLLGACPPDGVFPYE